MGEKLCSRVVSANKFLYISPICVGVFVFLSIIGTAETTFAQKGKPTPTPIPTVIPTPTPTPTVSPVVKMEDIISTELINASTVKFFYKAKTLAPSTLDGIPESVELRTVNSKTYILEDKKKKQNFS